MGKVAIPTAPLVSSLFWNSMPEITVKEVPFGMRLENREKKLYHILSIEREFILAFLVQAQFRVLYRSG